MSISNTSGFGTLTLGDADPTVTDLEDVYLDKTLVLVAGSGEQRSPDSATDRHQAAVGPDETVHGQGYGASGPAWEAQDLYTSAAFTARRRFAEVVSQWADRGAGWAVLSAEHGVIEPWNTITPYETTVEEIGGDERNPDHRVDNPYLRRRPDGREIVTEMDQWAAMTAYGLMKWVAAHQEQGGRPDANDANTLLVVADESWLAPLRERGVFEYGIARMTGNPNEGVTLPLNVKYLYESIDAGTDCERMAWLSDSVSRLGTVADDNVQVEMSQWNGDKRVCAQCGATGPKTTLRDVGGEVTCEDCRPRECTRCGDWTHKTGMGQYPLCTDCQTEYGGQKREEYNPETTEQGQFGEFQGCGSDFN